MDLLHSQVTSNFGRAYREATLTDASKCHHSQVLSLTLASVFIHQSNRFDSVPLGTGSPLWHISFRGAVLARVSHGLPLYHGFACGPLWAWFACGAVSRRDFAERCHPGTLPLYYLVFVAQESCSTKLDLTTRCRHKLKRVCSLSSLCKQPGHRQSRSLSSLKPL